MPTRFREVLLQVCAGKMTVTRHPDGCALIYPQGEWIKKKAQLLALPYSFRAFQRMVMGAASDVEIDSGGRVLIPAEIRQECGLGKEVVLIGLGNHFELWDEARLKEKEKELEADLSVMAESFNF